MINQQGVKFKFDRKLFNYPAMALLQDCINSVRFEFLQGIN
uniref:Uncharacterized protein n=1 Tax=Arundo donax TaxID=35708 RepID=A0A0A9U7R0_ARUDO